MPGPPGAVDDRDHPIALIEHTLALLLLRLAGVSLGALRERFRRGKELGRLEATGEPGLEGLPTRVGARRRVAVAVRPVVVVLTQGMTSSRWRRWVAVAEVLLVVHVGHLGIGRKVSFFTSSQ